jgi:alkylated DNA nucleotide flippase Atl1
MSSLWTNSGEEWELVSPAGFDDEAALHSLVEEAPQMLPLSGSPSLVVVGREVQLGGGYVDLLAIEFSGRPVVIEVKLARNAEARRAVVAQALAYAAFLNELDARTFEIDLIAKHIRQRGYESLEAALMDADQSGAYDAESFRAGLEGAFAEGSFRVVFVLDEAPIELVRLVGYLESVTERLVLDLVTVRAYEIGGSRVLVPQRVDPGRARKEGPQVAAKSKPGGGSSSRGVGDFLEAISRTAVDKRRDLQALAEWAERLDAAHLAQVTTYTGQTGAQSVLPRLAQDNVGLVTLWNENGASIQFWRTVFERRAPNTLERLEALLAPMEVKQGNTTREISAEILEVIWAAYEEAARSARKGFDWARVRAAIEAIPPGSWTTYGDLATLAGTAAMPVGQFVAREVIDGAWRVLGADGRPRPDFRWYEPGRTDDVVDVLNREGVRFLPTGAADPAQRLRTADLAGLLDG